MAKSAETLVRANGLEGRIIIVNNVGAWALRLPILMAPAMQRNPVMVMRV
jgi:hypothetical protein